MLEFPSDTEMCRVRSFKRNPRVWMSFPEPFEPGLEVTATWLAGDRVVFEESTPPLEWGMTYPDWPATPPPEYPEVPPRSDDPSGWTPYAPI